MTLFPDPESTMNVWRNNMASYILTTTRKEACPEAEWAVGGDGVVTGGQQREVLGGRQLPAAGGLGLGQRSDDEERTWFNILIWNFWVICLQGLLRQIDCSTTAQKWAWCNIFKRNLLKSQVWNVNMSYYFCFFNLQKYFLMFLTLCFDPRQYFLPGPLGIIWDVEEYEVVTLEPGSVQLHGLEEVASLQGDPATLPLQGQVVSPTVVDPNK